MKKYLPILLTIFIIGYFTPVACGDAGFLSGTGGEGEEAPTEEVLVLPSEESESVENPISTPNTAFISNFYSPTLAIILTSDNEYKTEISIPPMGKAEYQVTAPNILELGEESNIELILVPYTFIIHKDQIFNKEDRYIFQSFQGDLLIYPRLKAELVAGNSFSVSSTLSSDQIITLNNPTKWIWYLTPLNPGEHKISVNISVPVSNAGTIEDFPLETIEFYINIPTPTPTPTPGPLSGGAGNFVMQISLTLIGSITTIFAALITANYFKNWNDKKKSKETREVIDKGLVKTKNDSQTNANALKEKRDAIHKNKK